MEKAPLGLFIIVDSGLEMRIKTASELNIHTAQILAPEAGSRSRANALELITKFTRANIQISVVFCGFAGESYASIAEVEKTVGLAPEAARNERIRECKEIIDYAEIMGVKCAAMHLGFIPKDLQKPVYTDLITTVQDICDYCAKKDMAFHLETGQEEATTLLDFIICANRPNLGVNFDPANMILYGAGEPISALRLLGHHVKSVHCKDAKWADNAGTDWGKETLVGEGDVDFESFFITLSELGYNGPLTIEREITGEKQIKDIEKTVAYLTPLKNKIWRNAL